MRLSHVTPAIALLLLMSACGASKEDNQVTETRMDNLDSLEGTISDDMINTDQSTDAAPVEGTTAGADTNDMETPKTEATKDAAGNGSDSADAKTSQTKTEETSESK